MIGLTRSAAVEYAPRGIRINALCPGVIDTPMVTDMVANQAEAMAGILKEQPIGRLGSADEVAPAVLWLCSPRRQLRHRNSSPRRWWLHRPLMWVSTLVVWVSAWGLQAGRGEAEVRPSVLLRWLEGSGSGW